MKKNNKNPRPVSANRGGGDTAARRKNPLLIIVAVIVSLGILIGVALGVVSCVLSMNAVMEYEGVRLDKKVASYLSSTYKSTYLAYLRASGVTHAEDNAEFWQSRTPSGSTYGEDFEKSAEQYLRQIVVGVYLYDRYADMTDTVKDAVRQNASRVAEYYYKTEGYEALFEKDAAAMGYDYDAFEKAALMLYKYRMSQSAVWGNDGAGVAEHISECDEYLALAYTHVEFLFIRSRTTFELGEDGSRLKNADGTYVKRLLTEDEMAERGRTVEMLRALIDSYYEGASSDAERISPDVISTVAKEYMSDQSVDRIEKGYYFSASSEYSESFSVDPQLKRVKDEALALELDVSGNGYAYLTLDLSDENGNSEPVECIMYKSPVAAHAYADADLADFFTDFYSDAAGYVHTKALGALAADVKVKDAFYELGVALIPYNDKHVIREFSAA